MLKEENIKEERRAKLHISWVMWKRIVFDVGKKLYFTKIIWHIKRNIKIKQNDHVMH